MKRWQRLMVAAPALVFCVAAAQWAMRGLHQPTGNVGYLGTEEAGVEGTAPLETGQGVRGTHSATGHFGILGRVSAGVYGEGPQMGVLGFATGVDATGVRGDGEGTGVWGNATGSGSGQYTGIYGTGQTGVSGYSSSSAGNAAGVTGTGLKLGVWGLSTSQASDAVGVYGDGVGIGVSGRSVNGYAVKGYTIEGTAVYGMLAGSGHAGYFDGRVTVNNGTLTVVGPAEANAGYFQGPVHVNGTLSKSAGSFKIDHPLDPQTKYLSHSFVESPDMKNMYDGVVTLTHDGSAIVELPEWFEALNKDFRYQLTCIGEHAPVYVAEEIAGNRFRIAGGYRDMKVSWQVTGTRQDLYAKAYPIVVEEAKAAQDVGRYLHPQLYQQPAFMSIGPHREP